MILSIVIPNYNGSRTLKQVIESIFDQIPGNTEVILVDDCSTDQSVELVKSNYPSVKIYKNSSNLGAAATRNLGIKQARGDWILFVDADVVLSPGCIASLLGAIKSADIIFPTIYYPNGKIMYPINEQQEKYLLVSPIFLIRASALDLMYGQYFDETYHTYCEDTDFFLKACLIGLVSFYESIAQATHNIDLNPRNREERYYLETRNSIYGAIKFYGIKKINSMDHAFKSINILKVLLCGMFNFNLFDMQARGIDKSSDHSYNINLLLKRHESLSERGSFALILLQCRAIFWNIKQLQSTLNARKSMSNIIFQSSKRTND